MADINDKKNNIKNDKTDDFEYTFTEDDIPPEVEDQQKVEHLQVEDLEPKEHPFKNIVDSSIAIINQMHAFAFYQMSIAHDISEKLDHDYGYKTTAYNKVAEEIEKQVKNLRNLYTHFSTVFIDFLKEHPIEGVKIKPFKLRSKNTMNRKVLNASRNELKGVFDEIVLGVDRENNEIDNLVLMLGRDWSGENYRCFSDNMMSINENIHKRMNAFFDEVLDRNTQPGV